MSKHLGGHNILSFVVSGLLDRVDDTTRKRDQLTLSHLHQGVDYSIFWLKSKCQNC